MSVPAAQGAINALKLAQMTGSEQNIATDRRYDHLEVPLLQQDTSTGIDPKCLDLLWSLLAWKVTVTVCYYQRTRDCASFDGVVARESSIREQ